jgi:hypothetical protein
MKTALQRITTKAKELQSKFPTAKWTDLIKKASTELKKVGAIGDWKKNKAEFEEARTPKKPRKKRTRSANVYSVKRNAKGRFVKRGMKKIHEEKYKVVAGIGATKKRATKTSTHKDTKSHNVNIRVMSGVNDKYLDDLNRWVKLSKSYQSDLLLWKDKLKTAKKYKVPDAIKTYTGYVNLYTRELKNIKQHIAQLKKHIK